MRHPSALPAVALLAGTAAGACWSLPWAHAAAAVLAAWLLAALAFRLNHQRLFMACVALGFVFAGATLGSRADRDAVHTPVRRALADALGVADLPPELNVRADLAGILTEDASASDAGGARLALDALEVTVDRTTRATAGGIVLTVTGRVSADDLARWTRGRRISVTAQLKRPARYLNPGVPDLELASARRGITLVGSVKSPMLMAVDAPGTVADETAARLRAAGRRALDASMGRWSPRSAAIARAVILGDRTALDEETEERLQRAGTYHVIAISGGNIAILAGLLFVLTRGLVSRRGVTEGVVAGVLVAYAFLVGGGASVTRATLMAVIVLLARAIDARGGSMNILATAAAISLVVEPLLVFDPGAWLTYGATLAIIAGGPAAARLGRRLPAACRGAVLLAGASVCAELALLPVAALVFSRITVAGVLLNFVAIPAMTIVQVGGMTACALSGLAPAAAPAIGWVAHLAAWTLVESARLVDVVPWLSTRLPPPPAPAIAAYYLAWLLGLAWHRARPFALLAAAGAACWIVAAPASQGPARDRLSIAWIDVGQGDCELIQFPGGESWLVDTGGTMSARFDIARRVVEPAIWARGLRRLDRFVFTHGDNDHVGGAPSIVRDLQPAEIWEGVPVPADAPVAALRLLAASTGAAWRHVERGGRSRVGPVDVAVWNPEPAAFERPRVRNDDSVVIALRWGEVLVVLPGDVESASEAAMASAVARAPITIVQAPHHGSRSSSSEAWLSALRPAAAVISVGRNNRFGHPAKATLDRYRAGGAEVFRTDLDGAVTLETDGRAVVISTFTGRRMVLTRAGKTAVPPA